MYRFARRVPIPVRSQILGVRNTREPGPGVLTGLSAQGIDVNCAGSDGVLMGSREHRLGRGSSTAVAESRVAACVGGNCHNGWQSGEVWGREGSTRGRMNWTENSMGLGGLGAILRVKLGRAGENRISRPRYRDRQDHIQRSGADSACNRCAQVASESAIWLLRNSRFFEKVKSAAYSTFHKYVANIWGQCMGIVRAPGSAISNRHMVLVGSRQVRVVNEPPAF
jgi:hypothetical protein